MKNQIKSSSLLHVRQVMEGFEVILGFETRNKYRIRDENFIPIAFAAEKSSGLSGTIFRQILGHWRSFKVILYNEEKQPEYILDFPFRWFFKTLFVKTNSGSKIGHLQQRFAIFRKKFDLFDKNGRKIGYINSSFFRFWTFDIYSGSRKVASIQKKWSGALTEIFSDKDNFVVSYLDAGLDEEARVLILSTCLMVDIIYFENNQGSRGVLDLIS